MLRLSLRRLATECKPAFRIAEPPQYTLASLRSFPSLEPHTFVPLPASFFCSAPRKDFLWSAAVYEADNARIETGKCLTKSDKPFSNRKLYKQKGTGKARVGDANSPHRYNGIKAHVITAPHDWSTELPQKIYSKGFQHALAEQYRNGRLFVIGGEGMITCNPLDRTSLDFGVPHKLSVEQFIMTHNLHKLNLLFITHDTRHNLVQAVKHYGNKKPRAIAKEDVEVRDILRANRVYIDLPALQWMIARYLVEAVPTITADAEASTQCDGPVKAIE